MHKVWLNGTNNLVFNVIFLYQICISNNLINLSDWNVCANIYRRKWYKKVTKIEGQFCLNGPLCFYASINLTHLGLGMRRGLGGKHLRLASRASCCFITSSRTSPGEAPRGSPGASESWLEPPAFWGLLLFGT